MQTMFPGIVNSPVTQLSNDITNSQTTISITDPSKLPSAPNEATIGTGEDTETITYTDISGNDLTGCVRGFEGIAKGWSSGTSIGRNFTNYDYSSLVSNIDENNDNYINHINSEYHSISMSRQAVINGNFELWLNGIVFINPLSSSILAEKWELSINADGGLLPTIEHSQSILSSGSLPGSVYSYRVDVDGSGTSFGSNSYYYVRQKIINGVRCLCGLDKKVTVSFWAKSNIANKRIGIYLQQLYGTLGSPSAIETLNGTNFTLTSTLTKYTFTFTTNTLSGKTFGTNNDDNLIIGFMYQWGSSIQTRCNSTTSEDFVGAGYIDISQVQVCAGDVDLLFMPRSYNEELNLNQDYSVLTSKINDLTELQTDVYFSKNINTDITLRKWRFALARLLAGEEAIYNLNFIGDSITEGKVAGNSLNTIIANSFIGIIRNVLKNRYGDVGIGISPVYQLDSLYPAWSFTGDWTTDTANLGIAKTHKYTFTQNDTATFSFNGTGLRILAVTGAAGSTFSATVDGGTPVDFNSYNATTVGCAEFAIDGLSDGDHTVVIKNTDSNTAHKVRLIGAYPIKGNKGIRVNMMGKVAAIIGNYVGSALADVAVFNILPPTLTIISLIANDYSQNIDPATYKTNLETLVDKALTIGDVLITTIGISTQSGTYLQSEYVTACQEVATAKSCSYLDIYSLYGSSAIATSLGYYYDSVHPNVYGHRDIASIVLDKIL